MENEIRLVRPTEQYSEQVMSFRREMLEAGEGFDGCAGLQDAGSFEEWLDFEGRLRRKYGEGYVPSDVFIAVRQTDGKVVGVIDLRRPLSPYLLKYSGNIGYSVRPSERRKGYAGEMLRQLKRICRELGESRVLVSCDKNNEASRRTIEKNGGVLENEVVYDAGHGTGGVLLRYWIEL